MGVTRTDKVYEGVVTNSRTTIDTIASATTFVMKGWLVSNQNSEDKSVELRIGSGTKVVPNQVVPATDGIIQSDINVGITTGGLIEVEGEIGDEIGDGTTQFDITNPSGDTHRYTYDSTGTDPEIVTNLDQDDYVYIQAQNFSAGNNGTFKITGVGANYFEVTNSSGVVETNKTIGTGSINKLMSYYIWGVNEVTS